MRAIMLATLGGVLVGGMVGCRSDRPPPAPAAARSASAETGPASAPPRGSRPPGRSRGPRLGSQDMKDAFLIARVGAKIGVVRLLSVQVDAKAGTVSLTGSVKSAAERAEIERLAKSVEGVVAVKNDIRVAP